MTVAPIMSITDELIAELEAAAMAAEGSGESWYTADSANRFPMFAADKAIVALASPAVIRALLAERDELKRDAHQLRMSLRWALGEITNEPYDWSCQEQAEAHQFAIDSLGDNQ